MANPSLAMIPSGYKAGTLYSVLPTDGISDFTVDRNSIATRVNEQGLIEEVAVNVPRLDYSDGGCPVLLTEPESTNLVLYSEPTTTQNGDNGITYENYSWSNGFTNCIKYDYPISEVFFYKAGSAIASTENTLSVFVIMDDLSKPSFGEGVTNDAYMRIATIKSTNYTYKNCGNNIWRVSGTATSGSINLDANDIQKDTANSLKGFRVVGWQLEQGSIATSYIPTQGTTVTRLADVVSVTTPSGVTEIIETINGVEQTPITVIPATYTVSNGKINKIIMQ